MREPVRGKERIPNLGMYGPSCADGNPLWVHDYLHTNGYLSSRPLQSVLNRQRRRRQSPPNTLRGGLSRRQWGRKQKAEAARQG
jgi:hypothetical protein